MNTIKQISILALLFLFISCSTFRKTSKNVKQTLSDDNTFLITEISKDKTYGLSPKNPVEVGGAADSSGPTNERRYLNALTGPNGEQLYYFRAGSCCPIKSNNDIMGLGRVMLDNYRVYWQNSDTISIYMNMYDLGILKAPTGFGIK